MCIKRKTIAGELFFVSTPLIPKFATYLSPETPQQCFPNLETPKAWKEFVPDSEDLGMSQAGSSKVEDQPVYRFSSNILSSFSSHIWHD